MSHEGHFDGFNGGLNNGKAGSWIAKRLLDYRLTTAEITYHIPDYPNLLQTYVWQELDIAPRFPNLLRFLNFWEARLEGRLHAVKVAHQSLIKPEELRYAGGEFLIQ